METPSYLPNQDWDLLLDGDGIIVGTPFLRTANCQIHSNLCLRSTACAMVRTIMASNINGKDVSCRHYHEKSLVLVKYVHLQADMFSPDRVLPLTIWAVYVFCKSFV